MKMALMQPYFLPYIGYYQLINAVDTFIYYDDVNYIKQGWINRNRILLNGESYLFTLELMGASSFRKIMDIEVGKNRNKLLKTICQAYYKAPSFKTVEPLLYSIFNSTETNLSKYIIETQQHIINFLGIKTRFLLSSEIEKDNSLKGQSKVINICQSLGAKTFINSIGGTDLYSKEEFGASGIVLKFLKPFETNYFQSKSDHTPWLSIVDVMMFNDRDKIKEMLARYDLI